MTSRSLHRQFNSIIAHAFHRFQIFRLTLERYIAKLFFPESLRVLATACWSFPIYSQTFVYQELTQLMKKGFRVRFLYSKLDSRDQLPSQFDRLWHARRRLDFHPDVCRRDYLYFKHKMPARVSNLIQKICDASGKSAEDVEHHGHFLQAFAFARLVEAYRPDYLHSYFFYEGTLFAFFASYLLNIPRGVSCYADHMLQDYDLKMVPLHLEQCGLVIATSKQIKEELLKVANKANPNRILVKPNAINTAAFGQVRNGNHSHRPYRLVSVSRIEEKKGLIYLVDAVKILRDRGVEVEWHVIGGVDSVPSAVNYATSLRKRVSELQLENAIHFEGRKTENEIKRYLARSDLFVAPFIQTNSGDKDGIPTALLEGMAAGLPTVATRAGSIGEVISDGADGVLIPERDAGSLADAIETLLKDEIRRKALAESARLKIKTSFDVNVCEKIFHDRLKALVSEAKTRPSYEKERQQQPRVSAIIIFYNAEKFLREAIESVRAQTYKNWELLLIDDGSTDSSTQIAHEFVGRFPEQIRYLQHPDHKNLGMSATRNLGIRSARGEFIAFLDSDDIWYRNKLKRQVALLDAHPEAAMVYGATQYWYGWTGKDEDYSRDFIPELGLPSETVYHPPALMTLLHPLAYGTSPCPSDLMIRRKNIEEIAGFEEQYRGILQSFEDQAFLAKVYLNLPVYVSSESWDKYRIHPESCLVTVTREGKYEEARGYFLNWLEDYLQQKKVNDPHIRELLKKATAPAQSQTPTVAPKPQVDWGMLNRLTPVSDNWGFERGLPIDRYYIENFMAEHAGDIRGTVLEIEDDMYTRRYGGDRTRIHEILHVNDTNPRATIIGDLATADHIPSNTFDCIIVTQTLQLIYDLRGAAKTLHRILKPNGILLATFPGITRISHSEWSGSWYWSMTTASTRKLFGEFFAPQNLAIEAHGNVMMTTAFLYGFAAEEFTHEQLHYRDPDYEFLITLRAAKEEAKS